MWKWLKKLFIGKRTSLTPKQQEAAVQKLSEPVYLPPEKDPEWLIENTKFNVTYPEPEKKPVQKTIIKPQTCYNCKSKFTDSFDRFRCKYCHHSFCSECRLPEDHDCKGQLLTPDELGFYNPKKKPL